MFRSFTSHMRITFKQKKLEILTKKTVGLFHSFSLFCECFYLYFVCIYQNKGAVKNDKLMLDQ